jgi:hypothetical protein
MTSITTNTSTLPLLASTPNGVALATSTATPTTTTTTTASDGSGIYDGYYRDAWERLHVYHVFDSILPGEDRAAKCNHLHHSFSFPSPLHPEIMS